MRRATTPTHEFTFDVEPDTLSEILLTYSQNDKPLVNKRKEDFTFVGNTGYVTLTQEETNLFKNANEKGSKRYQVLVEVQIRAKTIDGNYVASPIWHIPCRKILNDEVMA